MISPTLDPKQENEPLAETERLILRFFRSEDENDLHEILGDEETMRFSEPAFHPEQTRRFLADFCIAKHGAIAAVQKETGKVIGYLLFREDSAEVYEMGWFFNRQYWGKGYAQEACRVLLHYAFTTCRAHRVFAETTDGDRCVRLMRRLTMKPEGVLRKHIRDNKGNWADMILYGILIEEWQEKAAQKTDACISTFRMEEFL